jgi:hypothetical protein
MRTPGGVVVGGRWGRSLVGGSLSERFPADRVAVLVCCVRWLHRAVFMCRRHGIRQSRVDWNRSDGSGCSGCTHDQWPDKRADPAEAVVPDVAAPVAGHGLPASRFTPASSPLELPHPGPANGGHRPAAAAACPEPLAREWPASDSGGSRTGRGQSARWAVRAATQRRLEGLADLRADLSVRMVRGQDQRRYAASRAGYPAT